MEHPETVWSVLTSPAHVWAEIILMILFDGLVGAVLWPLARRRFAAWRNRLHTEFDVAHGIEHDEEAAAEAAPVKEWVQLPLEAPDPVDEAFASIVAAGFGTYYTPPSRVLRS